VTVATIGRALLGPTYGGAWLSIAGVRFVIRAPFPLLHYDDPAYSDFLSIGGGSSEAPAAIEVELLATRSPVCNGPTIFECDVSWRMQRDGDGYCISLRRLATGNAHTIVWSDRATSKVRAYVEQDRVVEHAAADGFVDPVHYPLDQLLLMHHLSGRGGVVCHAASAVVGSGALVFAGISGAGKTTISNMFINAGLAGTLLSDDRIVLRTASSDESQSGTLTAWGTPWPGDAKVARNRSAPLTALLFLVKAGMDELVPLRPGEAMRRLMPVVSSPWYDPERLPGVLETCSRLVEGVPCYDLRFSRTGRAVELLTRTMA
jgi:hypothetical protein